MRVAVSLAVVVATACLASVQAACLDGYVDVGDATAEYCVYFITSKATWAKSREFCKLIGDDLAKLEGDAHQKVMAHINTQPDLIDEPFWIGGSDANEEDSWVWVIDETEIPLISFHWYPCDGQPNGGTSQNHLSLYPPDFYFHSLEGSRELFSICQKP